MKKQSDFDYEQLDGQRVASIMGRGIKNAEDGLNVDEVAIGLERMTLLITVNLDTDEIILKAGEDKKALLGSSRRWKSLAPLSKYVGKELGWSWAVRNYRGYSDLFVLSFHGIEPQIVFCGIASSLWIYRMKRI